MKTTTFILALLLTLSSNLFAQNWVWQNPLPGANELFTSYFFDQNTGYIGGEMGTLYKTTNGGINISVISTGYNYNINSITFLNASTGYMACGYNEKVILKTTNGGNNWSAVNLGTPFALKDIKFINPANGIAVSSYQMIYYTTNGGLNWTGVGGASQSNYAVEYVTPSLVYAGSSGGLIQKSTNGGLNWVSQSVASSSTAIYDIQFLDSLTGYACGTNTILKTTNGGLNWINTSPSGSNTIYSISFTNPVNGGAVCESGKFLMTTNGGTNWSQQYPSPGNYNRLNAIKYFSSGTIYLSGIFGNNMKSTDGGATWINLVHGPNTYIFSSSFLNASTGFASMTSGTILKTTNGGTNWTEIYTPATGNNISALQFTDANTGYAIASGSNDMYIKTTNAGVNWTVVNPGVNSWITDLNFINAGTGVLITNYKTYRTTNGGANWSYIDSVNYSLMKLEFTNSLTGYISAYVNSSTRFRKTTNGGLNWSLLSDSIPNTYVMSYKFFNANTGYAAGSFLYGTTNGGLNWTQLGITGTTVQTMHLFDANTILIGGVFGVLKKSTDGGFTFTNVPFVNTNAITTMSFIDTNTGWIMGQGGMILKTNNILTNGKMNNLTMPVDYELFQNYPNPFNPTTKISFSLPASGRVSLKVYDILGRLSAELVNDYRTSGTYTVEFNAGNLSSGIYFYKLEANGRNIVRKMVVLK